MAPLSIRGWDDHQGILVEAFAIDNTGAETWVAETSTATAGNYVFETLPLGNYRFGIQILWRTPVGPDLSCKRSLDLG